MLDAVGSKVLYVISELVMDENNVHYYKPVFFAHSNLKAIQFCKDSGKNDMKINYFISNKAVSLNQHKKLSRILEGQDL